MSVHKRSRDGRYFTVYLDASGVQRRRIFGTGQAGKKDAEAFDLRLKADRKQGIKPEIPSTGMYIDQLAQKYLDERKSMGNPSSHYIYTITLLMNGYIMPVLSHKPVDELTYVDMLKVAEIFKDRKQATRNRYFGYLRAIFRFGVRHGLTKNNPLQQWKKPKEDPRPSLLAVEDVKKIIASAPEHLRWGMEVQWNLGCRPGPSELFSIRWQDVDFEKPCVRVYATKTKKWREVPISEGFKKKLLEKRNLAQTEFLIEYNGQPIKRFRRSFQTAVNRAGITVPARMYDLRHLFASLMLSGGADLAAVSKLLGHSSTHMTANVYYDLLKGEKEKAVALLPAITQEEGTNSTASGKVISISSKKALA
jgi:integrase